ncbi:hypothetical protein [Amycolatopsis sp. GM8]|uniref:hypothetical protein n=1 Tax=Amycolatopsis sp. GM8 TaxID=2896530 RepID=UPI001F3ED76C|nr:hypothetical protein [Amycolatopsis sp. GM8]
MATVLVAVAWKLRLTWQLVWRLGWRGLGVLNPPAQTPKPRILKLLVSDGIGGSGPKAD